MHSSFYRRAFAIATLVLLAWVLNEILRPLWGQIGWAAVLAFLLHPLHVRLTRRLRGRAGLSAGTLTVLTPFLLVAPLTLIGVAFARQVANIIERLRGQSITSYIDLNAQLDRLTGTPVIGGAVSWMRENAPISAEQVRSWLTDGVQTVLAWAASMSGSFAIGVMGSLVGFFVMLFLLFFLLRDGGEMLEQVTGFIPMDPAPRAELLTYLGSVTRAVVFGSTATALIQGIFVGAGFALVGLPSPVVFGVLATLAAFLPAGSSIVLIPAILYVLFEGRWGAVSFLAVWGVAMVVVENVLRPILTSQQVHVSTVAVFLGAIGGAAAFGILGLVIGPVVLGFATALLQFARKDGVSAA